MHILAQRSAWPRFSPLLRWGNAEMNGRQSAASTASILSSRRQICGAQQLESVTGDAQKKRVGPLSQRSRRLLSAGADVSPRHCPRLSIQNALSGSSRRLLGEL